MTNPNHGQDAVLFDYAPISLWVEDYQGIKSIFDGLRRDGVTALDTYIAAHPELVDLCMGQIRVLDINQQTLVMFKAATKDECLANLDRIFRDGMRQHLQNELLALWQGEMTWSGEGVNYTLAGDALHIILHWRILPGFEQTWERVLVSIEDITERKRTEQRLYDLFEASPISLWEEDYRELKRYFDQLRAEGMTDLDEHLRVHPEATAYCMSLIRVLNVNQKTLALFGAKSKEHLLENLGRVFRDEMGTHFAKELVDLWNGRLAYEREGINYTLNDEALNIQLVFRVMPSHEHDFGWVLVSIQDITARKKAEDYLLYLGTHDVMTAVYNRAFFEEALMRLERNRRDPISIVIADLNGLKTTNDTYGHQAGDNLIRRAAEVLKANFDAEAIVARIGGDEFAIILPGADEKAAETAIVRAQALIDLNNKYYRDPELSISMGSATSKVGLSLEKVISLADQAMYQVKVAQHKGR